MPVIHGFDSVWPAAPEWLARFDFAIAPPPIATWSHSLQEESSGQALGSVRYKRLRRRPGAAWLTPFAWSLSSPPSAAAASAAASPLSPPPSPLHSLWSDTDRVFYTHFLWRQDEDEDELPNLPSQQQHDVQTSAADGEGTGEINVAKSQRARDLHCVTRQDLVGAFIYLVNNAELVYMIHADLRSSMIEFEHYFMHEHSPPLPLSPTAHALLKRAESHLGVVAAIADPTSSAAEYFGAYLSFLSDLECAQEFPRCWQPFTGRTQWESSECSRVGSSTCSSACSGTSVSDLGSDIGLLTPADTPTDLNMSYMPSPDNLSPPSSASGGDYLDMGGSLHNLGGVSDSRCRAHGSHTHFLGAWRPASARADAPSRGVLDSYAFLATQRWLQHGKTTMCPSTDCDIAAARAEADEIRGEMYAIMKRDMPPPWDRSVRRTSVVALWEEQVRRNNATARMTPFL